MPLPYPFSSRREVHADFEQLAGVFGKRCGVSLFVYLPQRIRGTPVQLDFYHVDIIGGLDQQVDTAAVCGVLNLHVKAEHLEQDVHRILEIDLHLAHHLVTVVCKQRLQAFKE